MTTTFIRKRLPDALADYLRDGILNGSIAESLPDERSLAFSLNVSRSSLRAALDRLASEGLIGRTQGKRTRVRLPAETHGAESEPVAEPVPAGAL